MKEIIINKIADKQTIMLLENGTILEKYEEGNKKQRIEGNIYIGKVENVLPGMQAAFVNIGEKRNAFIHLKDLLPKFDETKINIEQIVNSKQIKDVVKKGDRIIVQVKKDANRKKGARVSKHISLVSRFFVLMPDTNFITISQKIVDEKEKNRIMQFVKDNLPKDYGVIIRTSAKNKNEEELNKDLTNVIQLWKDINKTGNEEIEAPKLIYKNPEIIEKLILDVIDQDINRIVVNNKSAYDEINGILKKMKYDLPVEIREDIIGIYDIEKQLEKIQSRKVWLKCGGFITIDKTEALTAIDVNSGKYIGNKELEQTVFTVNKEASVEIAKQLRLRDIGGIVIIDYIDMKKEQHKQDIIKILEENLKKDRSKTQVVGFSKLNLLEMTRKHICSNQED